VDMGHEPDRMVLSRDDTGERHKPADADEEMSPVNDEHPRGTVAGGSREVSREGTMTTLGETTSRRKARTGQLSPVVGEIHEFDVWNPAGRGPRWVEDSGLVGLGLEYSHMRVMTPAPSLYLQPGSKFVGTQQSERQRYDVEVEIKHVDMRESFLCGYLKIQGLFSPVHSSPLRLGTNPSPARPNRRPPDINNLFRGRDHRHQVRLHHAAPGVGREREDRPVALVQVHRLPAVPEAGAQGRARRDQGRRPAREHLYAVEGALPRARP
jgi:hypothetical protein